MVIAISLVTMYSIQYADATTPTLKFDQPTIILNHGDTITYIDDNGGPAPIVTLTNTLNYNTMDLQLVNVPGTNIFRTMVKFTSDSQNDFGIPSYGLGTTLPVQVFATVTTPATTLTATSTVKVPTPPTIQYPNRRSDNNYADCTNDDQDGDGICDSWENSNTLTVNYPIGTSSYSFQCGDSTINPRCGSDKRDIFVEIDYMSGHKPNLEAIQSVVDAFANAPDPDGTGPIQAGIRLHVQMIDETTPISHTDITQFPGLNLNGRRGFDQIKASYFGTPDERSDLSWWNNIGWKQKKQAFHYVLFVHNQGTSSSGTAEILGNDVLISLGSFDYQIGNPDQQAGTLMHELGHNLNLNHGGGPTDVVNCKPNYLSVMSYSRQFSDLVSGRPLNFSSSQLDLLDENNLNETNGLTPKDSDEKIIFGPVPPIILPSENDVSIDWNQDTIFDASIPQIDINSLKTNSGKVICPSNTDTQYSGYDDWTNIVLDSKGTGNWADGRSITSGRIDTESPICPPISALKHGSAKLNRVCGGGFGDTDYVTPIQYEKSEIKPIEKLTINQVTISQGASSPGCETTKECYNPDSVEIRTGDTVSWSNDDTAAHTVTSGTPDGPDGIFDSSLFMAGSTFEFTFDKSGTYPYFCMVHPWMTGEIVVNEINDKTVNKINDKTVNEINDKTVNEIIVEESSTDSKSVDKTELTKDKTKSSKTLDPVDDKDFENISYENSEITSDAVKSMRILRIDSLENYVNMHSEFIDKDSTMKIIGKYNDAREQINDEKYADVIKTLNSIDYEKLVRDPTIAKKLKAATADVLLSVRQAVAEPIPQHIPQPICPDGQKMNEQGVCVNIIDTALFYWLAASAIIAAVVAAFSVKKFIGKGSGQLASADTVVRS